MTQCSASYALEHAAGEAWPSGEWRLCPNEGTMVRFVPITDDCIAMLNLCPAHWESWKIRNEAVKGLLGVD